MKQKIYYILIISIFFIKTSGAQSFQQIVDFADDQYDIENYEVAAKEYNRALFFGEQQKDYLSLRIGNCYNELEKYSLATIFYDKAYMYTGETKLANEAILGGAYSRIMQKRYMLSVNELMNYEEVGDTNQMVQYHFLFGLSLFGAGKDSLAYLEFEKILEINQSEEELIAHLQEDFEDLAKYEYKFRAKKIKTLSTIFPGLGQLYIGEVKEGINSMALVATLFYISYRIALSYTYLDALLTVIPWMQRYYMGGMEHAYSLSIDKIDNYRYKKYLEIIEKTMPKQYQK